MRALSRGTRALSAATWQERLLYGQAGSQPAPTTRPLGPRYDRRDAQGRGHGAQGTARRGAHVTSYDTALERLRHGGFGLRYGRGPRPRHGQACLRYDQVCARLGAPVRTWACLLGQLGAPAWFFRTGFRLGDIFESPFGPGS